MIKKILLLTVILALSSCTRKNVHEDEYGILSTTLKNGLRVLIKEDHSSPMVSVLTRVKAGFLVDPETKTGLSHLLEHMYFKGTQKRKNPQDIWIDSRSYGATLNAWTNYDETAYWLTLPSRYIEQGIELQIDALANPTYDPTELAKETEVVIQEGKRAKDNPTHFLYESLPQLMFTNHRMGRWRIGSEKELRSITRQDILDYFHNYYKANNMILTIVGDIHARETLKLIRHYAKQLPSDPIPEPTLPQEPEQNNFRFKRKWADIKNSYIALGFHIPRALHEDTYALDVIAYLLGNGRMSRLNKTLMLDKELVNAIWAYSSNYKDVGLFRIQARLNAKNIFPAELAILTELERLKHVRVSIDELEKVKNNLETEYFEDQNTTISMARTLSHYEQYGDYKEYRQWILKLLSVTPEDIQRVAQTYFQIDKCSIFEYTSSQEQPHTYPASSLRGKLNGTMLYYAKQFKQSPKAKMTDTAEPLKTSDETSDESIFKSYTDPNIKDKALRRHELSNKAPALLKETHDLPLVALSILFKGGRLYETPKNSGITQLLLKTSLYGTTTFSEKEILSRLDHIGATLKTIAQADYFGYQLLVHQKHLDEALKIVADIVQFPSFQIRVLNREKQNLLSDIDREEDNARQYSEQLFREAAFKNHPYGLPTFGQRWTVLKISPDDLIKWHSRMVHSEALVISAVGDFKTLNMRTLLENYFKKVPLQRHPPFEVPLPTGPKFISENFKKRNKEQTAIFIGFEAPPIFSKDYYALKVMKYLTSSLGGRFGHRLRTQERLAYTVVSDYNALVKTGIFSTYTGVSPENERKALRSLLEEYKKLKVDRIPTSEINTAKNFLMGRYGDSLQSYEQQALYNGSNEIYGRPVTAHKDFMQQIESVTFDNLHDVANRYFTLEKYTLGIVRGSEKTKTVISTPPKPIVKPKKKKPVEKLPPLEKPVTSTP